MPRLRRTLCEQLADSISSAVSADNAVSAGSRHDKVDSPVAEAKPSTVARPDQSLALVFASGIIESTSMTRSAPAAKPSMPARRPGALTCSGIPSSKAPIASGKPSDPPPERPPIRVTAWSAREDHRTYAEANGNSDQPTDLDAFLGEFKGNARNQGTGTEHQHRADAAGLPVPGKSEKGTDDEQCRREHSPDKRRKHARNDTGVAQSITVVDRQVRSALDGERRPSEHERPSGVETVGLRPDMHQRIAAWRSSPAVGRPSANHARSRATPTCCLSPTAADCRTAEWSIRSMVVARVSALIKLA